MTQRQKGALPDMGREEGALLPPKASMTAAAMTVDQSQLLVSV